MVYFVVCAVAAVFDEAIRPGVFLTASAALLGMAAGRLISFAADKSLGRFPLLLLCVELASGACFFALRFR